MSFYLSSINNFVALIILLLSLFIGQVGATSVQPMTSAAAVVDASLISSSSDGVCQWDFVINELIDITGIEAEGKAKFLDAKPAASKDDCALLCCSFPSDDPLLTCNTGVYFPDIDRERSCFLVHCNEPHCGKEFLLKGHTENITYVIFMHDFHSRAPSTTTTPSQAGNQLDSQTVEQVEQSELDGKSSGDDALQQDVSYPIEDQEYAYPIEQQDQYPSEQQDQNPTEHQDPYPSEQEDFDDGFVVGSDDNDVDADDGSTYGNDGIDFGGLGSLSKSDDENDKDKDLDDWSRKVATVLIALFACVLFAAATVLIANRFYQQYQRRKLYDKLDYLSSEPLYGGSSCE